MPFEDADDLDWYPIDVSHVVVAGAMAEPVVGVGRADIDRGPPGMHARLSGIGDRAAVICSSRRVGVPLQ